MADPSRAAKSGVRHAAILIELTDTLVGADDARLERARRRVLEELGPVALVDAVAVASNFERMVRIADATGIPLDNMVDVLTSDIRAQLGIDRFTAAANTRRPGLVRRALRPVLRPALRRALRALGRRRKAPGMLPRA